MQLAVGAALDLVRKQAPLVHHLTNWVTIYDCAALVKALGASPVMAHAPEEMEDMVNIASSLVLNIGTLTVDLVEAMKRAAKRANARGVPVVLDVCGAGATGLRDQKVQELLGECRIDVVKGNASEIARVAGLAVTTRGVDSTEVAGDLAKVAAGLAKGRGCTVVVTGAVDVVTDGTTTLTVANGDALMGAVVGTGCMAASAIGTFAAVEKDLVKAAAAALVCYEVAGEQAAKASAGPASFKGNLLDAVYRLESAAAQAMQKVTAR
jgi:hydroxyethylthiazole kinase